MKQKRIDAFPFARAVNAFTQQRRTVPYVRYGLAFVS